MGNFMKFHGTDVDEISWNSMKNSMEILWNFMKFRGIPLNFVNSWNFMKFGFGRACLKTGVSCPLAKIIP
jgi:hypothetical protein